LKCPNCNEEILDEEATFCPNCGASLEMQPQPQPQQSSDYVLASAILAIIAAAFSAGLGATGLYQYIYWFATAPPQVIGFLIYGIVDVVASAFVISAAAFILKRRFMIFSLLGAIFPLFSAVVTFIAIYLEELFSPLAGLGFMDTLLLSEISMGILAILSTILLFKSRNEFVEQD
jgi:hypothetical protein